MIIVWLVVNNHVYMGSTAKYAALFYALECLNVQDMAVFAYHLCLMAMSTALQGRRIQLFQYFMSRFNKMS